MPTTKLTYAPENPARAAGIVAAIQSGESYGVVAKRFHISRARVYQIVSALRHGNGSPRAAAIRPVPDVLIEFAAGEATDLQEASAWLHMKPNAIREALRRRGSYKETLAAWSAGSEE